MERWEYVSDSWEDWVEGDCSDQWDDEIPWWLSRVRDRSVIRFDFDPYIAAAELASATMMYADTPDSIQRRAEIFSCVG